MTAPGLVSAIVVNWNGAHHLETCLPSLQAQDYQPLEILVVDNASEDASEAVVRRSHARWLPMGRNLGLAGACNEGARAAAGDMLLFLNTDLRFAPDFAGTLVRALHDDDDAFAADARQRDWDDRRDVHVRTRLVRRRTGGVLPGWDVAHESAACTTTAFYASAAAMLVRRDRFEALGGFDAALRLGWEDTDICWRAWSRSWCTLYVPGAVCWHRVGGSSSVGRGATLRHAGTVHGRLHFSVKALPAGDVGRALVRTIAGTPFELLRNGLPMADRLRRAGNRLYAVLRVAGDLPRLLAARRECASARTTLALLRTTATAAAAEGGTPA